MILNVNSCEGIYNNSLDIRFTKQCDNHCAFCIERKGIDSLSLRPSVEAMVEATLRSNKDTVLILGGEPLLYPEAVLDYIEGIKEHIPHIYLTTSLPRAFITEDETIAEIMQNLEGLNVSLHHYDPVINNDILRASQVHNRLSILKRLNLQGYTNKIRVSVNLVNGYIDTPDEVFNFLDCMVKLGVTHVKFNELQHEPDLFVSFERIMSYQLPSAYSTGCQTVLKDSWLTKLYPTLKLTLKRSCGFVEESVAITQEDLDKVDALNETPQVSSFLVLYEDGSIHTRWEAR